MTRPAPTSTVSGPYSRSAAASLGAASSATDSREVSKTVRSVRLREVRIERVSGDRSVSKHGSCFEDAGGY